MTASYQVTQAFVDNAHRPGQQAPPHTTYPAGQADTDVATHVAAKIVASIPKILIVRMASLLIIPNRNGTCPQPTHIVTEFSVRWCEVAHTWVCVFRFIIAPVIVIICTVGAYSVSNSYLDVVLMVGFGILGYLFKKLHYPLAPLVLAIVIGDKAEDAIRRSMLMSRGSLKIFFSKPLVTTLILLGAALLLMPVIWRTVGRMLSRSPLRPEDREERRPL